MNLVEWLKTMVTNRNAEGVLDPKIPEKPSSRALKRALLVALRCVDPSAQKRPKMGHVIHMLEADDFPFRDVSSCFLPFPPHPKKVMLIPIKEIKHECLILLMFYRVVAVWASSNMFSLNVLL